MTGCNCENCELKALFFQNVSEKEFALLCDTRKERNYKKGETIIEQGAEIKEFSYLKTGLVKLYKHLDNGKNQIIKIAGPLDFINLLSIFSDRYFQYSVAALEDTTVCYVNIETIKEMVKKNGNFAFDLLRKMSRMTDEIINTTLEISRKNLRGRIAFVLLYFARSVYKNNTFELPVSRKEIAEFIEMTPENVIRILSEFRKDGIIRINGKEISITDEKRLSVIAELG